MSSLLYDVEHYAPYPFNQWGYRIGRVEQIASYPCAPTPELWVRAFWHALPTLLLTPVSPSATDYLIVRLGGAHGSDREFSMDIWENAGLPKVPKSGLGWQVWRLGSLVSRALWYMAIADAVTGFLLNWQSTVYQYAGCQYPGEAFFQGTMVDGYTLFPNQQAALFSWNEQAAYQMGGGGYYVDCNTAVNPSVGLSISTAPSNIDPHHYSGPTSVQICCNTDNNVVGTLDLAQDELGNWSGNTLVYNTWQFEQGNIYYVRVDQGDGYAEYSGYFSLFGAPQKDQPSPFKFLNEPWSRG